MPSILIRQAEASDYTPIISVVNDWWGGRSVSDMLPKLFFVHFRETSFVADQAGEQIGFLIGFLSQSLPEQAYIHFIGVHPAHRREGIARVLYQRFFETVRGQGRRSVRCITSPLNTNSIAFHLRMGFQIEPGAEVSGDVSYSPDYEGAGRDRVLFVRHLD